MMKYIKPPEFKSVKQFQAYYAKVEKDIAALLTTGRADNAQDLQKKLSLAIASASAFLTQQNQRFIKKELAAAYAEEKAKLFIPPNFVGMSGKSSASLIGMGYAPKAVERETYIDLQKGLNKASKDLQKEVQDVIKELHKKGADSIYETQEAILELLKKRNLFEIEYANGAKQSLETYATMVARTARIKTVNIAALDRAKETGTDLVQMTTMPGCCSYCAAYEGKVYSISGKDKRFPSLYKTVFKRGYEIAHPNCRHEFIPYYEQLEDPKDVEKAIKDSEIKYDKRGNLLDVRTQKDIESYAHWQSGNRQRSEERLEYKRMQAYYGKDMPYKTLGAYRREARKPYEQQSPALRRWRIDKKDKDFEEYNEIKRVIGRQNAPKTFDKFLEIKYNDKEEYLNLDFSIFQIKTRKLLNTAEFPIKLNIGDQGKHIKNHNNYQPKKDKSYFIEGEAEKLFNLLITKCGTGEMQQISENEDKKWSKKELIVLDIPVGFVKDVSGDWVQTNRVIAHYSRQGVHFVPTLRKTRQEKKNDNL